MKRSKTFHLARMWSLRSEVAEFGTNDALGLVYAGHSMSFDGVLKGHGDLWKVFKKYRDVSKSVFI